MSTPIPQLAWTQNDLSGRSFGLLVVLGRSLTEVSGTRPFLRVRCKCGFEKDSRRGPVVGGKVLSCGSRKCRLLAMSLTEKPVPFITLVPSVPLNITPPEVEPEKDILDPYVLAAQKARRHLLDLESQREVYHVAIDAACRELEGLERKAAETEEKIAKVKAIIRTLS